jgi:hypothetical protein
METNLLKRSYNGFLKQNYGSCIAQYRCLNGNNQPVNPKFNLALMDDIFVNVVSETIILTKEKSWVVDSGVTAHICANKNMFTSYKYIGEGVENVILSDSRTATVLGKGKVNLKLTSGKILSLSNVLHVPDMNYNLVCVSILSKAGIKTIFDSDKVLLSKCGGFVGKGFYSNGLFILDVSKVMNESVPSSAYLVDSVDLWHGRLGHVNFSYIKKMQELGILHNLSIGDNDKCPICVEAKSTKKSCKPIEFRETKLLGLIHSDLGDLKSTMTRGGKKFYITFIDDLSRYSYVYLLRSKDEAEEKFKIYKAEVENKLNVKIKRLRTDRGGEYDSNSLSEFCEQNGIVHEVTPPYSPESNGIAERKNRTLKEMMNAMLLSAGAPSNLWGEAILSACHIQNRIIFKKTNKTPFELWEKRMPNLKYLKVWGCLAKVLLPEPKKRKIGSKTCDCMFIGYASNSAAYRFLVLKSDVLELNTIIESKNAEFFESVFPLKSKLEKSLVGSLCESDPCSDDFELEPRRSTRIRKETNLGDDFYTFLVDGDPLTYSDAISSPDGPLWKEAINNEIQSIMSNHTWEIVDLPQGAKTIGCKWIFKRKLKPDGSVEKYKARLVAKGYTQKKDLDYFDTYSPVARMTSIRVLIAIASIHNLVVHQMDVKTAFLNGDLEEEIYMDQPEGFVVHGKENKVCRLVKSLYGLKQAPKQWHEKFDKVMLLDGYKVNGSDKCVYTKFDDNLCGVIVCLYVDDMLILGTNIDVVNDTKQFLSSKFDMKDLGEADLILGIKLTKLKNGFRMSQEHFVEKILRKFDFYDSKPVSTPYDGNLHLKKNNGSSVSQTQYAQIIGSLMYLMNCSRPDIAYAVNRLSRYTHNPGKDHWNALCRVLKYLRGTMNLGLCYVGYPSVLEGYTDANWISDSDETKSTSGFIFSLGGAAVTWKSSKQTCIARSTMEAEFIALDLASSEAEWLRNLLADIPLWKRPVPSISINCDCQAAIARANNNVYNGKRRHICIRHNSVKQLLHDGVISLTFVRSEMNLADPFTKPLNRKIVEITSRGMGLMPNTKIESDGNPT